MANKQRSKDDWRRKIELERAALKGYCKRLAADEFDWSDRTIGRDISRAIRALVYAEKMYRKTWIKERDQGRIIDEEQQH